MSPGESFATETEITIDLNQNGGETSGFLRFDLSAFDACTTASTSGRARSARPATWACRPRALDHCTSLYNIPDADASKADA